ncbi:Predicted arabinose efflux permease, MFS family [Streptomyces sp. DvalAA-14]|uniref:MFS transporter n=1 Tax=unclassified Streptomyces TaxID=2593676 RepID=UPI00081B8FEB|nr:MULTISPECIES: MFS transporter [unclassified Streptomyces]MYS24588.1 MFS transporter [Streptomyces sp. SID4948]SCE47505.1 Predicted arabinose efflux permease, MFS family [Streptomyces sp. DvalAA-14]
MQSVDAAGRAPASARRAHVTIAVAFAVHGAVNGTFATRIPWIKDHLHLSAGQLGLALVCPALGSSLLMPLAGRLMHRYGSRAALRLLLGLFCLLLPLPALAPGLLWLCLALLVFGASAGMTDVVMNALGVAVEERKGKSIMSGLHGMWSLGTLVGAGIGVPVTHLDIDARIHLGAMAALLLTVALLICATAPDLRPGADEKAPPRFALPPRAALVIGAIGFCGTFAEGGSSDWCAVYLRDITHASPAIAALAYTGFSAAMVTTRLLGDFAVRRLGAVTTLRTGGVVATVGGALVVASHSPVTAIGGFALLGVGVSTVVPLCFAAAGRRGPVPSQAIAGVATVTYTSGLIAPAAIGGIAGVSSLTASFAVVTVLALGLVIGAGVLRAPARAVVGSPAASVPASAPVD